MTDNLDGTYTYNYSASKPGQITVSILQYTQGGVYQEFFPNIIESGDNQYNGTISQINMPNAIRDVYPGRSEFLSANYYFRFKGPITGIVTFYISVDDDVTMTVDNTLIISGL